jgi:hypothetical protein
MLWNLPEFNRAPWNIVEFRVEVRLIGEYKDPLKKRIRVIEHVYIYGYVSFAMGVLFLLGLIGFTWIALRRIHVVPAQ